MTEVSEGSPPAERTAEELLQLEGILRKVKALLAQAEGQEQANPAESAAFRAKAEELMKKYRIKEEGLIATDQFSIVPVLRSFEIVRNGWEYEGWMATLFSQVMRHVDAEHKETYEQNDAGLYFLVGKAVGYDSDLRYADMLWQSVRLAFISHLTPEVDPKLSDEENIYRLRSAGIARKDVAEKLWGKWTHSNSAKVGKVYKAESAKRGEVPALDGKGIHLKDFRGVYAREFVYRVWDRLADARNAAMAQGGAIDLSGRADRVKEKFWEHFPDQRPKPPVVVASEDAPTETAKKARRRMAVTDTKAYKEKVRRQYDSPAARAGAAAGRTAGDKVAISRTAPRTKRLGYEGPADDPNDQKEVEA